MQKVYKWGTFSGIQIQINVEWVCDFLKIGKEWLRSKEWSPKVNEMVYEKIVVLHPHKLLTVSPYAMKKKPKSVKAAKPVSVKRPKSH